MLFSAFRYTSKAFCLLWFRISCFRLMLGSRFLYHFCIHDQPISGRWIKILFPFIYTIIYTMCSSVSLNNICSNPGSNDILPPLEGVSHYSPRIIRLTRRCPPCRQCTAQCRPVWTVSPHLRRGSRTRTHPPWPLSLRHGPANPDRDRWWNATPGSARMSGIWG